MTLIQLKETEKHTKKRVEERKHRENTHMCLFYRYGK